MSFVVAMFLLVYLFGSLIAIPAKAATQERDVSYSADYTINSEYIDLQFQFYPLPAVLY